MQHSCVVVDDTGGLHQSKWPHCIMAETLLASQLICVRAGMAQVQPRQGDPIIADGVACNGQNVINAVRG